MSVEQLFRSKISGSLYRYGPSIQPGEIGYLVDLSGEEEKVIIAHCDHEDEGGVARGTAPGEFERLSDAEIFIPQDLIDEVAGSNTETGTLFEGEVKLLDGDEGTLVIHHANSNRAVLN